MSLINSRLHRLASPSWLLIMLALLAGIVLIVWNAIHLSRSIQKNTILTIARSHSKTISAIRDQYLEDVASFVTDIDGAEIDHNRFPVAYTVLSNASEKLQAAGNKGKFKIVSEFPWPNRKNGGPQTPLERRVLERILSGEEEVVVEHSIKGHNYLLYAEPVLMKQNCVSCHNARPDSPRRGWSVGDIRGAQLIDLPIEEMPVVPSQQSSNSLATLALVGLLSLATCVAISFRIQKTNSEAQKRGLLGQVTQSIGDGIVCINTDGTISSFNRTAEKLFGYTETEIVGQPSTILMSEEDAVRHAAGVRSFVASNGHHKNPGPVEVEGLTKSGESIPISMVVTFATDIEPPQIIGSLRDLRPSRDIDKQLSTQRLKDIGRLTSGVAHDFNNLLQVIDASATMLLQKFGRTAEATYVQDIVRSVDCGAALTRNLLSYAGRENHARQEMAIENELRQTVNLLERTLNPKITIELSIEGELWPVFADIGGIESAFVNVAFNARDAMKNGGKLRIEAKNYIHNTKNDRHCQLEVGMSYVEVSFLDNGVGVARSEIDKVFDPFYSTKEERAGRGLGLGIIRNYLHEVGGEVCFESELGHWTKVTLYFPKATKVSFPNTRTENETGSDSSQLLSGKRILLVDDDQTVRCAVQELLKAHGIDCSSVESGAEAIERLNAAHHAYDLLVTDLLMPEMSGTELAVAARKVLPQLPIIVLSGNIGQENPVVLDNVVALEKPIRASNLIANILKLFKAQSQNEASSV